jgi:hypothetical protein
MKPEGGRARGDLMVKLVGQRDLEAERDRARPAKPKSGVLYRSVAVVRHPGRRARYLLRKAR